LRQFCQCSDHRHLWDNPCSLQVDILSTLDELPQTAFCRSSTKLLTHTRDRAECFTGEPECYSCGLTQVPVFPDNLLTRCLRLLHRESSSSGIQQNERRLLQLSDHLPLPVWAVGNAASQKQTGFLSLRRFQCFNVMHSFRVSHFNGSGPFSRFTQTLTQAIRAYLREEERERGNLFSVQDFSIAGRYAMVWEKSVER
jgi:hypothetical protein